MQNARAALRVVGAIAIATPSSAQTAAANDVEVTIGGERPSQQHSARAATTASTVLRRRELSRAGDTAADVLRQVPGVQINRVGATTDPATASIRGTDAKQVPVYLAGVRINDEVNGAADLSTIPLWMMQRVEIFRGNAPAFQTDLGLGGAVYFEPLEPRENRLGLELHHGSFGRRGGSISAQVGGERASALVSVRASAIDNNYPFLNDHGLRFSTQATEERRVNADANDVDAWAIGSYRAGRLHLHTIVHAFDREQGTSGIATSPARTARTHQQRLLGAVSGSYSCATTWSCLVLGQASMLVGRETLTDPNNELRTIRSDWQHSQAERASASLRAQLGATEQLVFTPLATAARDTLELDVPSAPRRLASRTTTTLGLETTLHVLPQATAVGMLRGACYDTQAEYIELSRLRKADVSHCPASPDARLGADYELTEGVHVLGNWGHTFREPTLGERYGVSSAVQGEPHLKSERSYGLDLGTRGSIQLGKVDLTWDAFVFRRSSSDLVRYRRTSLYAFTPYNVGHAVVSGVELSLATQLPYGFSTQSTATLVDPRDTTPGRRGPNDILPMTSRLTTFHELRWTHHLGYRVLRQTMLGARYYFRSNRFADPAGLVVLPAVQSVDAQAGLDLANPRLGLSLALNNILDQQTLDYLGLPVPGRSYHVSMTCWW